MGHLAAGISKVMEHSIHKSTLRKRHNLPWLNESIVQAIRRRNRLYKQSKRTNSAPSSKMYTRARNRVTAMLRNAKKSYLRSLKEADNGNLWKAIKHLNKRPTMIPDLNSMMGMLHPLLQRKPVFLTHFLQPALIVLFHH